MLNWKYKGSSLYVPSIMSNGWIVSKVEEGGGGPNDFPPPSSVRVIFFLFRLLRLIIILTLYLILIFTLVLPLVLYMLRLTLFYFYHSGGVGPVVKISASQPWGPQFDSRPGQGLNIWVTFFPAKVHSAFHPPEVGKMSINGPIWSGYQRRLYMLPVCWG